MHCVQMCKGWSCSAKTCTVYKCVRDDLVSSRPCVYLTTSLQFERTVCLRVGLGSFYRAECCTISTNSIHCNLTLENYAATSTFIRWVFHHKLQLINVWTLVTLKGTTPIYRMTGNTRVLKEIQNFIHHDLQGTPCKPFESSKPFL